jgi:hypothetical protein
MIVFPVNMCLDFAHLVEDPTPCAVFLEQHPSFTSKDKILKPFNANLGLVTLWAAWLWKINMDRKTGR